MQMKSIRRILAAAGLAALSAVTATAHHEATGEGHYLAFWAGYRPASAPMPTPETCPEGRFWEKGFVSIYSHGAE